MTSGGGTGGAVDTAYIEVELRDNTGQSLRELEQNVGDAADNAGKQGGERLSGGLKGAFASGAAGLATVAASAAAAAATAVAGAVIAGAKGALDIASQANQGLLDFQAQLGASAEEAQRYGEMAKQVFGNNWGESLSDAQQMLIEVRRQMKGLSDEDLVGATNAAAALKDVFGVEINESTQAANTLMKDFGLSSAEAFDFIAKGFQNGLNNADDFLDTIGEYAPQFGNGGASADQFFSTLKSGQQGAVLGLDKVADTFKEFGLLIRSGGEAQSEALKGVGIDADDLMKRLANGSTTTAQAFTEVQTALKGVKDKNDLATYGAALFGTQFEDAGAKATLAVDLTSTKLKDLGGGMDAVSARSNTLKGAFQTAWRQVLLQLEPVGQQLLSLANDAMPYVQAALKEFGPIVSQVVTAIIGGMREAKGSFSSVAPVVQQAFAVVRSVIGTLAPYIVTIFNGVKPVVQSLGPLFGAVFTIIGQVWNGVLKPVLTAMAPFFAAQFGVISAVVKSAVGIVTGVLQAVSALLKGDVSGAANILKGAFERAASGMGQAVQQGAATVMKALGDLPARVAALAGQIIAGLVDGIRNGVGRVGQAARDMAQNFIGTVTSVFDIRSPSRVMAALGVFTAQGFVNGIASKDGDVKKAAQNSAGAFLQAFKDLQVEKELGKVDLTTYTKTLNDSASALRAKLGTVKEGTPAYTAYLGALSKVQKELDAVRGKTQGAQEATKKANDEAAKGRGQIAQAEAAERLQKAVDNATDAQLRSALQTAKASGDVEKYNVVKAEQQQRETEAAAAQRRATDAARQHTEQIKANRKAIEDGLKFDLYATGLQNYSDAQLQAARVNAIAAGDQQKFSAVLAEQRTRAEEAARAIDELVDAQIKASASRYADTQGASDAAYRQSYGTGDAGLQNALQGQTGLSAEAVASDTLGALADLEKWNASAAAIVRRVWADELQVYSDNAAEKKRIDGETEVSYQRWYDNLEKIAQGEWIASLRGLTDEQLQNALTTAEAAMNIDDYNAVLAEQKRRVDDADRALDAWNTNLDRLAKTEAVAALRDLTDEQLQAAIDAATAAKNVDQFNAALSEQQRRAGDSTKAHEAWIAALDKIGRAEWVDSVRDMSDAEIEAGITAAVAAENVDDLNVFLTEHKRRTDEAAKGVEAWANNLAKIQQAKDVAALRDLSDEQLRNALTAAEAAKNVDDYNAVLAEQKRRTDDAKKASDDWAANLDKIARGVYVEGLKKLTEEQLQNAITTAKAAKNVDDYNALLSEQERRAKDVSDAQALIKSSTADVAAALGRGEQPWAKQIAALQAAKGKSKELDAQIDALIASMQQLQGQAAQQAGFDKLKNTIGQVGDIIGKTFAMFGADAEIQQGISQLTAGIQDGVTAFAKFASGDILGGIQAALSGIMNIGNAIENLDPGIKAWKKGLLEVAAIEKELVGSKSYGNIKNPYYDTLMNDAAERERAGNSKWYQRLGWSIFGGAPQYMSEEAARFMAESARIFGEVAEVVVSGMDSALMNAFSTGDWTGAEEAMSKSLDQFVAKMALQAIIAASSLEAQIKAYAEARNEALKDGVIDAQEQANLDVLIGNIKAEQKRIADQWKSTAQTLPGYGADADPQAQTPDSTAQPGAMPDTVRVDVPTVTASIDFNVLGTLAAVIERSVPRWDAASQRSVEAAMILTAAAQDFRGIMQDQRIQPSGYYK